jgi:hypothetical protein
MDIWVCCSKVFVQNIGEQILRLETFLDSRSREKYVYKSEMELLLKVK